MKIHGFHLAAALAVVFASTSLADITNATYQFSTGEGGSTVITPLGGPTTHTAPANPGFCVGSTIVGPNCGAGSGLSGSFSFADINPTLSTITFTFFGSTAGAGPGDFFVDLGNFVLPDGDTITGVTYASGSLGGATTNLSWNGTTADFKWSTGSDFNALGGNNVVFNVAERSAVPEPSSIWLLSTILGGVLISLKKLRRA